MQNALRHEGADPVLVSDANALHEGVWSSGAARTAGGELEFAGVSASALQREFGTPQRPRVYADVQLSLNGRSMKQLIDPTVDLASRRVSMRPADWIVRQELEPIDTSNRADARGLGE